MDVSSAVTNASTSGPRPSRLGCVDVRSERTTASRSHAGRWPASGFLPILAVECEQRAPLERAGAYEADRSPSLLSRSTRLSASAACLLPGSRLPLLPLRAPG